MLNRDAPKRTTWLLLSALGAAAVTAIGIVSDVRAGQSPTLRNVAVYLLVGLLVGPLLAGFSVLSDGLGWKSIEAARRDREGSPGDDA